MPGVGLELPDHVEHGLRVTVRGVHDEEVDTRVDERLRPALGVLADAHRGADDEAAALVLGGVRELLALGEVLDGDEPAQPSGVVDQRQLLDLVLLEQRERPLRRHAHGGGDQRHGGHDLGDPAGKVVLEANVTICHDTEELAVIAGDRHAGDPVVRAQPLHVRQRRVRAAGDRVGDHTRF